MVKGMVSRIAIRCFSAVFLVETVLVGVVHQHADVACIHDAAGDRVSGQADNGLPAEAHSHHQHGACAHPGQDAERQSTAPRTSRVALLSETPRFSSCAMQSPARRHRTLGFSPAGIRPIDRRVTGVWIDVFW